MDKNVDIILNGQGTGEVASVFMANGRLDPGAMRPFIGEDGKPYISVFKGGDPTKLENYSSQLVTNATLRRDEWKRLDDAVLGIAETRLNGVNDVVSKGLTYDLGNGMGTTVLEWHDVGDALEAELTMDGVQRAKNDRPNFQHNYLPLPIIHAEYEINARALAASRTMGNPLDTTMAERASRKVSDKLEGMFFTDTSYSYGEKDTRARNTIYSYVNHPDRNQVSIGTNWDASAATGATIVAQVLALKQTAINNLHYGPWVMYIPTGYETVIDADYDASTPGTTIRERILKINNINQITVVDKLPANNVLLIQMTSDVVRLVRGMGIQNVMWSTEGNMVNKYKVMTIQVPQIRSDQNGKSGIVHCA